MIAATKWMWRGMFNYTKSAYEKKSKHFDDLNQLLQQQPQQQQLSAIVTGANSGIGYASVIDLLSYNCRVHMVCRNNDRGMKAFNDIKDHFRQQQPPREIDPNQLSLHICDVSLMHQVESFVNEYLQSGNRLDILVLNAGVMVNERKLTTENIETTFATNLLSPFYMTKLFLPLFKKQHQHNNNNNNNVNNPARVIFVSSGGMLTQMMSLDFEFNQVSKWDSMYAYAQTKRAMIYLVELFEEHYGNNKQKENNYVNFYAMHPGWVSTPALEGAMPTFNKWTKGIQRTPEQGCDTITWLSLAPLTSIDGESGDFFEDRKSVNKHLTNYTISSRDDINQLWNYLNERIDSIHSTSSSSK